MKLIYIKWSVSFSICQHLFLYTFILFYLYKKNLLGLKGQASFVTIKWIWWLCVWMRRNLLLLVTYLKWSLYMKIIYQTFGCSIAIFLFFSFSLITFWGDKIKEIFKYTIINLVGASKQVLSFHPYRTKINWWSC